MRWGCLCGCVSVSEAPAIGKSGRSGTIVELYGGTRATQAVCRGKGGDGVGGMNQVEYRRTILATKSIGDHELDVVISHGVVGVLERAAAVILNTAIPKMPLPLGDRVIVVGGRLILEGGGKSLASSCIDGAEACGGTIHTDVIVVDGGVLASIEVGGDQLNIEESGIEIGCLYRIDVGVAGLAVPKIPRII